MKNKRGMSLAPFCILMREGLTDDQYKRTLYHEMCHWPQQKRLWYIGFYIAYIYEYFTEGYKNISFEIQAREATEEYFNNK